MGGQNRREMPPDFAQLAPTLTERGLRLHYAAGVNTVSRWLAEAKVAASSSTAHHERAAKAVPADYRRVRASLCQRDAAEHYGVARGTARRWDRETGVDTGRAALPPRVVPQSMVYGARRTARKPTVPLDRAHVDITPVGRAVDYLRRYGPVFRCSSTGRAVDAGDHWRRGPAILTDADVIQRAERLGWAA